MCSATAGRDEGQEMARKGGCSSSRGCELAKGFMPCAHSVIVNLLNIWGMLSHL